MGKIPYSNSCEFCYQYHKKCSETKSCNECLIRGIECTPRKKIPRKLKKILKKQPLKKSLDVRPFVEILLINNNQRKIHSYSYVDNSFHKKIQSYEEKDFLIDDDIYQLFTNFPELLPEKQQEIQKEETHVLNDFNEDEYYMNFQNYLYGK